MARWQNREATKAVTVHGVPLFAEYTWWPSHRAPRDKWGQAEYPDEEAGLQITKVETMSGEDVTELMSERAIEMIEQQIKEWSNE